MSYQIYFRSFLISFLIFVLIVPAQAENGEPVKVKVTASRGKIHLTPSMQSPIISEVPVGTILQLIEEKGEWDKVSCPPDLNGVVKEGCIPKLYGEWMRDHSHITLSAQKGSQPSSDGGSMGLGFKLSGGAGYLLNGAGDLETNRQSMENFTLDCDDLDHWSTTFGWDRFSYIPDFSFEFIIDFMKYFGVGIGTGYITGKNEGTYNTDYKRTFSYWWGTSKYEETQERNITDKISAVPVTFNLYFFLPLKSLEFYLYLGPGYYMGKFSQENSYIDSYDVMKNKAYYYDVGWDWDSDYTINQEATCNKLGFQGGVGLNFKLSSFFSIGLEMFGRMVNFNEWEGEYTYESESTLRDYYEPWGWYSTATDTREEECEGYMYLYETILDPPEKYYDTMWILESPPTRPRDRKAEINLNSFGINLSLKFRFELF